MKKTHATISKLAALACAMWVATGAAQSPETQVKAPLSKEQLSRRLDSVGTLIDQSSAARQIEISGVPDAVAGRSQARELHRRAEEAYRAEDYPQATRLLNEASKKMFEAVRLAKPEEVLTEKKQRDYAARLDSVKALLDALKRIASEKGANQTEAVGKIENLVKEAGKIIGGDPDRGRMLLDQAYALARLTIESLRGGDTLVRSLKFATKEEEYLYEMDRNETHQMLIKVFVVEKMAAGNADPRLKSFVDKAEELRRSAEELAARKEFEGAIKALEDSTQELQRAIRNAGIYIPG